MVQLSIASTIWHPKANFRAQINSISHFTRLVIIYITGEFNVYDGMAFPESEPSTIGGFFKKGLAIVGLYKESDLNKSIPSHLIAQEASLRYFLQWHRKILVNMEFSKTSRIVFKDFVNEVFTIFLQLRSQITCFDQAPDYNNPRQVFSLVKVSFHSSIHG